MIARMTTRRRLSGTIATRSARSRSSLYEPGARRTWCSVDRFRRQRCAGRAGCRRGMPPMAFGCSGAPRAQKSSIGWGFCYSIELVANCRRPHWPIGEVLAQWREHTRGISRFQVTKWLPAYLRWYFYAFATTYLRRCSQDRRTKTGARYANKPFAASASQAS